MQYNITKFLYNYLGLLIRINICFQSQVRLGYVFDIILKIYVQLSKHNMLEIGFRLRFIIRDDRNVLVEYIKILPSSSVMQSRVRKINSYWYLIG